MCDTTPDKKFVDIGQLFRPNIIFGKVTCLFSGFPTRSGICYGFLRVVRCIYFALTQLLIWGMTGKFAFVLLRERDAGRIIPLLAVFAFNLGGSYFSFAAFFSFCKKFEELNQDFYNHQKRFGMIPIHRHAFSAMKYNTGVCVCSSVGNAMWMSFMYYGFGRNDLERLIYPLNFNTPLSSGISLTIIFLHQLYIGSHLNIMAYTSYGLFYIVYATFKSVSTNIQNGVDKIVAEGVPSSEHVIESLRQEQKSFSSNIQNGIDKIVAEGVPSSENVIETFQQEHISLYTNIQNGVDKIEAEGVPSSENVIETFQHSVSTNIQNGVVNIVAESVPSFRQEHNSVTTNIQNGVDKMESEGVPLSENAIENFRQEHNSAVQILEHANTMLHHYLFGIFLTSVPIVLFALYGMIRRLLTRYELFLVTSTAFVYFHEVIIYMICGALISLQAHSPLDKLLSIDVRILSDRGFKSMRLFIDCLKGSVIGFRVYELLTLDPTLILVFVGTLVTYTVVMLQFTAEPQSSDIVSNCTNITLL